MKKGNKEALAQQGRRLVFGTPPAKRSQISTLVFATAVSHWIH